MRGYLVRAKGAGKLPAVLCIHENRGLNPHIEDVTRRLALAGYLSFAPDALAPLGGYPGDEDSARAKFQELDSARTKEDFLAAFDWLRARPDGTGKVGAIGFCWGGGAVNNLAVNEPNLSAGVAYYGGQPKAEDVPKIQAALMLHYAGLDERINAGIQAYEAALKQAGKTYEIYVYEGANHAFNNDTNAARYDKEAADLAWRRTVMFLKKNLA